MNAWVFKARIISKSYLQLLENQNSCLLQALQVPPPQLVLGATLLFAEWFEKCKQFYFEGVNLDKQNDEYCKYQLY